MGKIIKNWSACRAINDIDSPRILSPNSVPTPIRDHKVVDTIPVQVASGRNPVNAIEKAAMDKKPLAWILA